MAVSEERHDDTYGMNYMDGPKSTNSKEVLSTKRPIDGPGHYAVLQFFQETKYCQSSRIFSHDQTLKITKLELTARSSKFLGTLS